MGEPNSLHFYDYGIFGRVPRAPTNNIIYLWGPQDTSNNQGKSEIILESILFLYISECGTSISEDVFEKTGAKK